MSGFYSSKSILPRTNPLGAILEAFAAVIYSALFVFIYYNSYIAVSNFWMKYLGNTVRGSRYWLDLLLELIFGTFYTIENIKIWFYYHLNILKR